VLPTTKSMEVFTGCSLFEEGYGGGEIPSLI